MVLLQQEQLYLLTGFNNIQWVRYIVMLPQSDQQYDIQIYVRDTAGLSTSTILGAHTW
jgi:hypothetical protein